MENKWRGKPAILNVEDDLPELVMRPRSVYVRKEPPWTWERCLEMNEESIFSASDPSDSEDDQDQARADAEAELYRKWYDGTTRAFETLAEYHGLRIKPIGVDTRPWRLQVLPETSWEDAALKLVETINGVGHFYLSSVKEFVESGPYDNARHAVLAHLHWMRWYPEVYGAYFPQADALL